MVDCDYSEESWRGDFVDSWAEMLTALRAPTWSFEKRLVVHRSEELIESLLGIQKRFFANQSQNELDLRIICEELVQPLKEWWRPSTQESMRMFHFLVKCNIAERLNAIGVKKCKSLVKRLSSSGGFDLLNDTYFDSIHSKLVAYEQAAFAGANKHAAAASAEQQQLAPAALAFTIPKSPFIDAVAEHVESEDGEVVSELVVFISCLLVL